MLDRDWHLKHLRRLLARHRVVAILGMRQVGKTTLARALAKDYGEPVTAFDLENPADLGRLTEPLLALQPLRGLIVLDEIQRRPDLFPILRVLADRPRHPARFLVLGSASPDLLRQSSESLAGRISYFHLDGFSIREIGSKPIQRLWLRGGLPRSYLARSDQESLDWRRDFIQTFLERDLPQLGSAIPPATLRRFWTMLAHYHGRVWNSSDFARSFGVSDQTVRRYLDLLTGAFVVNQLPSWAANVSKRQVKSPKIYLSDSGLLHALLELKTWRDVEAHPVLGASWEGFLLSQVTSLMALRPSERFFWATHSGAELDLLVVRGRTRRGFEFKRTVTPSVTPSMRSAMESLDLQRLDVIHAGDATYPLTPRVRAVAAARILEDL